VTLWNAASVSTSRLHHFCIIYGASLAVGGMLNTLTVPALTFIFLGIVAGLAAAFVLMLWEVERRLAKPRRHRDRLG
jgi:hypothetical protein